MKKHSLSICVLIIFIVLWQLLVTLFEVSPVILPAPTSIILCIITNWQLLLIHFIYTFSEAIVGIVLGIMFGIGFAIFLFNFPLVQRIVIPYVNTLQMVPAIVIAPLFALWFGFGFFPKILLIVIFSSFPILITTLNSFRLVDAEKIAYLDTLDATKIQLYRYLYLPACLEQIFASIRIATTYALINAIFAEYMGAKYGLGVYLNRAASSFSTDEVFAVIFIIIITTLTMLKIVDIIEKSVTKWR